MILANFEVAIVVLPKPKHWTLSEVTDQCIQNILRLKPECDRYAMPLMIEPLVFQPNTKAGGYMVDGDPNKILPLVRQAVELGADIITFTRVTIEAHRFLFQLPSK